MASLQRKPTGPNAGVRKYDVISWIAIAGMRDAGLSGTLALRLIALVTTRYNWALDEASIGHVELMRLWDVSRRTVIRDLEKLRAAGLLVLSRPGRRGRVAAYRLDQARVAALAARCRDAMGPDLSERLDAPAPESVVVPFARPDVGPLEGRLRAALAGATSEAAVARWFDPLRCESVDGALTLRAPSAFHADYVERTLGASLRHAAASMGLHRVTLRVG